jgi:hypothetical protein
MASDPFCACCDATAEATSALIFNRPGLSDISYRIGTYASFRAAMLEMIAGKSALAGLTSRESADYAITLLELFAATGDVLTFYNERIANELFLRTARERDSLLRLTALLGYRLRPGLAAQTALSFTLDEGAEVRIRKGLKIMSVPGQDETPQIFETTEELKAHADLNAAAAFAPPVFVNLLAQGSSGGPVTSRPATLAVGDKLLVFGLGRIEEKTVASLQARHDGDVLLFEPAIQSNGLSPATARAVRVSGHLRLFGHAAPATVNVYVPAAPSASPPVWPRWETRQVDARLDAADFAYPLDARLQDLAVGTRLLIRAPTAGQPTLRNAVIVATEDRPAVLNDMAANPLESTRDTVTHVTLRQTIREQPAVAATAGTLRSVFARSDAGHMFQLDAPGLPARQWRSLGLDGVSSIASTTAFGNRRDVFVRDAGGGLQQALMPAGAFAGWTNRGGLLTSEPRAAVEAGGEVRVFGRGLDFACWVLNATSVASATWQSLEGILTSAPVPVSQGPGRFAVFARGLDRALWYRAWTGAAWSTWQSLGGALASAPSAISTGLDRIDVMMRDDSGSLNHRRLVAGEWSDWRNLGGEFSGDISLVAGGAPDRVDVFAQGRDGTLQTLSRNGETWSDWLTLPGKVSSSPVAVRDVEGLHVYARASDGSLASRRFAGGFWQGWVPHGQGIGPIADRRQSHVYRVDAEPVVFRDYDYPAKITQGRVALRMKQGAVTVGNLAKGRRILLSSPGRVDAVKVVATWPVPAVPGEIADHLLVDFSPAPAQSLQEVTLLGNVAASSHGETQAVETLGHGEGSKAFQSFKLARPHVTYLQTGNAIDAKAALELRVNGEAWTETPSFFGRHPHEKLYTARQNDNGETSIVFGDGVNGARLPSGAMNVSATYRTGLGLQGLMKAAQLAIPLERPPGLRGVSNLLPADGAANPDERESARTGAPASVKSFGRAVSLADFESVVTASGLAARAFVTWVWSERERAVHVTVAGPHGSRLSDASMTLLRSSLDAARDPNHPLFLANFVRVPLVISARLLRNPAFEAETMLADARARLLSYVSFEHMPLGEAVFASTIYATLQSATGVVAADLDVFQLKSFADLSPFERSVRAVTAEPLQPHIRIFPARPAPPLAQIDRFARAGFKGTPPAVLPAEQAFIENPSVDLVLTAVEAL